MNGITDSGKYYQSLTAEEDQCGTLEREITATSTSADEKPCISASTDDVHALTLAALRGFSLDPDPVDSSSMESYDAEALRRSRLRRSRIVFLCAGHISKKFIFVQARKYGMECIVIDDHNSWARELVTENLASRFVGVDMSSAHDIVLDQAVAGLKALAVPIHGVCTFVELSVSLAARLARLLKCPGPDPASVAAARDKFQTRSVMQAAGIPHVRNMLIRSELDLPVAAAAVGFPAVLKPVSGAASLGVQKVESASQLEATYRSVVLALSELVVSAGALERRTTTVEPEGFCESDSGVNANKFIDTTVLMEEYLDGAEVDVDVLMSGGICRYVNVIDNGPTREPFFGETWACLPSLLPETQVSELKSMAVAAVTALGFSDGVYHVELKYTSHGPRLIEVNARMGGGPTRVIHKIVSGVDLVREQFFISAGIPSCPIVSQTPLRRVAYAFINCRATGAVSDISFMDKYSQIPGVVWVLPYVKPFERFIGPEDGHPSWLGDVVVALDDGEAALRLVKEIEERIAEEFVARRITQGRLH